ncbi:MAG: hypothetical protein DWQ40_01510 [Actinobacteria bacterium]|nr:MAG: hypothetical protein DWQ40_01510 [Actinomycetota bacterium]
MPTSDCELITSTFLGQPVNTLTTIAFVAAGLIVARRPRLRWVGIALIATGVGSFLFHGPMPPGSQWAHDVTLDWLLLIIAGLGSPWERLTRLPGFALIGLLLWAVPGAADLLAVVLTAAGVVIHLFWHRSPRTITALLVLGGLAVFGRLGSTNGPFCDPESLLQPHGLWHLGAAVVVAWWVLGIDRGWEPEQPA